MAIQEASPASPPSAQVVGIAFVEQYYHILHHSPELVHRFYLDSSSVSRPDKNGVMTAVTSLQASIFYFLIRVCACIIAFNSRSYFYDRTQLAQVHLVYIFPTSYKLLCRTFCTDVVSVG